MKIILPLPPSTNGLFSNVVGRGRMKTKAYKTWLKNADAAYWTQRMFKLPRIEGARELRISVSEIKGDISNRIKAAEDFLVSRRLTDDDKNNRKVSIEIDASIPKFECWIEVRAL